MITVIKSLVNKEYNTAVYCTLTSMLLEMNITLVTGVFSCPCNHDSKGKRTLQLLYLLCQYHCYLFNHKKVNYPIECRFPTHLRNAPVKYDRNNIKD